VSAERDALTRIEALLSASRQTVTAENAWASWFKANQLLVQVRELAKKALAERSV
jgi:hypothetical protein